MDSSGASGDLLAAFRTVRQQITARDLLPVGGAAARDALVVAAAWLDEANDRIPRLLAGGPAGDHDREAFAAAALERSSNLDVAGALRWFRRAADRYETILADLTSADIEDEPEVRGLMTWIAIVAARCRASIEPVDRADGAPDRSSRCA